MIIRKINLPRPKEIPNVDVLYTSDGEYPFQGSLDELLDNFSASGVPSETCDAVREAVAHDGRFEGCHDFGRYRIERI